MAGRQIELVQGKKKWYSVHLTSTEIAISVRNGYVTVSFGPAFDTSSSPALDAIEVFAVNREDLGKWLPTRLETIVSPGFFQASIDIFSGERKSKETSLLSVSLEAFMRFSRLFPQNKQMTQAERVLLQELVKEFAMSDSEQIFDAVDVILASHQLDDESRLAFRDKAVLERCSAFLSSCQQEFCSGSLLDEHFDIWWQSIGPRLWTCFRAAVRIAKFRPISYFQSVYPNMVSPGVIANSFIPECFNRATSNLNLVSLFVELALVEIAVASSSGADKSQRARLGNFDGLRGLLLSHNQYVVALASDTISKFCKRYEVPSFLEESDCDLFAAQQMVAYYRCDRCELFPIKDVRYSLLDDSHPFDLCQKCYRSGKRFAASQQFSADKNVLIDGKFVGEETKLTCAEVKLMQPVKIQAEGAVTVRGGNDKCSGLSQIGGESVTKTIGAEIIQRHHIFDDFLEHLFTEMIALLVSELKENNMRPINYSVWVTIDIVHHSGRSGRRSDRARRLAKELVAALSHTLAGESQSEEMDAAAAIDSFRTFDLLRALVRLVVADSAALAIITCKEVLDDADEEVTSTSPPLPHCPTHNIPASRRKCSSMKGRKFFVCGKDRKLRCNFFAWADEDSLTGKAAGRIDPVVDESTGKAIWNMLNSSLPGSNTTIQALLCQFVTRNINLTPPLQEAGNAGGEQSSKLIDANGHEPGRDEYADGVHCCRSRLQVLSSRDFLLSVLDWEQVYELLGSVPSSRKKASVVVTALSLLSLIARPGGEATATWSPLLSELILSTKDSLPLKPVAKRALMQLCGRKRGLYATMRAHYAFGYQRQQLSVLAGKLLLAATDIAEKARQCGPFWKSGDRLSLAELKSADLLGTDELISEDVLSMSSVERTRQVLVSLNSIARKRVDNWRQFCGLAHFAGSRTLSASAETSELLKIPPVVFLFAVACLIGGENQVKAFRLLDLALTSSNGKQKHVKLPSNLASDDEPEQACKDTTSFPFASGTSPEAVLNLTVQDLYAFTLRYVFRGHSADLRQVASSIVSKICSKSPPAIAAELFQYLINLPMSRVGGMGKAATELLTLLQQLLRRAGPTTLNISAVASKVQSHWRAQMLAIRHGRTNYDFVYFEARTATSNQKKRYELSRCIHCQYPRKDRAKANSAQQGEPNAQGANAAQVSPGDVPETKSWHLEQVTPYSRGRLEGWRDGSTSDEFNSYASFKYRLVLSEVHLEVNDPRGRFVKRINIYFTPRAVVDVAELKSDIFAKLWQHCGTIELTKGATRGSCKLETPVVAANIKIEYSEFYERPGDSKSSDNSFVVHCPRCTRLVNNAHGVCGNCGEVAFQCRKCRHINYEKLDAFLCVECGYCASGGYCFELTAAIASNAIAICNDAEYERASCMHSIACRLFEDLRSALREKLAVVLKKQTSDVTILRRAFQGRLPLESEDGEFRSITVAKLGKAGSVVKAVARTDGRLDERACSLVRLTREWRDSTADARRPNVRRQISRLLVHESDNEDQERFAWLEGSGLEDPLTRLLASVQNRRERRSAGSGSDPQSQLVTGTVRISNAAASTAGVAATDARSGKATAQYTKETLELCDRLYLLVRGALYALSSQLQGICKYISYISVLLC